MENITDPGLAAVNSMPVKPETIIIIIGVCFFIFLVITGITWMWMKLR